MKEEEGGDDVEEKKGELEKKIGGHEENIKEERGDARKSAKRGKRRRTRRIRSKDKV